MKPPSCVIDRWAGDSLTRRPKGPFAVSWPRQLGKCNYNYKLQLQFSSTGIFQDRHFPVPAFSSTGIFQSRHFQYRHFPVLSFSSTVIFQNRHFPVPAFAVTAFSKTPIGITDGVYTQKHLKLYRYIFTFKTNTFKSNTNQYI